MPFTPRDRNQADENQAMKTKGAPFALIAVLSMAAVVLAVVVTMRNLHGSALAGGSAGPVLPGVYGSLRAGMTQSEVVAKLGIPSAKSVNAKFVHKSPEEWARLQAQVDATAAQFNDPSAVPSPPLMKLRTQMQHRIKDIWQYEPNKTIYLVLQFDESGRLLKWATAPAMPPGARPHEPPASGYSSPARQ